jgi:Peptidase family S41
MTTTMLKCLLLVAMFAFPEPAPAQLLTDQRVFDFQNLVALYAKRYAPYDWKRQAVGFDLFDVQPWVDRIRAAKSDVEFYEIEAEYVANLQDTHSHFQMTSSFRANLGITVDIYDGKVLIDSINRATLPIASYPFQFGDELVSVDGISSEDWIKRISTWYRYGNPVSTRRLAAGQITFRSQVTFPRAYDIGEFATVQIRRASGALETYTIRWTKTGLPVTTVGPVPFPTPKPLTMNASTDPRELASVDEYHNYKLPDNDPILTPIPWVVDEDGVPRTFVNGVGARAPIFAAGLPSNFVQRLGRLPTDFHYSGTYVSNGLTIGYLRIPSFSPNLATAFSELRSEIDYFQRNTDGLVVDVMRNPGGGCYMMDAAAALIPYPFYFFGELIRATQDRLNSMQAQLEIAQLLRLEDWVIQTYQMYVDNMKAALSSNRGMTSPIGACRQFQETGAPHMFDNEPAPNPYTKPLIILIDEFSISAADIFPSMMQDNGRGVLVGTRSSGGGGSVSGWPSGFYSESFATNTNTLVLRKNPIRTAEYPTAPYVENIGARPDVPLDFMTRENLLNGGRTFVERFTEILVNEITKQSTR